MIAPLLAPLAWSAGPRRWRCSSSPAAGAARHDQPDRASSAPRGWTSPTASSGCWSLGPGRRTGRPMRSSWSGSTRGPARRSRIGIPRDTWSNPGDRRGPDQRSATPTAGPDVVAQVVGELTGIAPDYVLHVGLDGFLALIDVVGGGEVTSPQAFTNDGVGSARAQHVRPRARRWPTRATGASFADERLRPVGQPPGADARRPAAAAGAGGRRRLHGAGDRHGPRGVETDLAPAELYRLAQFITTVDPAGSTPVCSPAPDRARERRRAS